MSDNTAIDSATAAMANTSLNETSVNPEGPSVGTGGDKPINASTNEAVIRSAEEGRRLYIGNLAYATTEGELRDFFKDYLLETASIPLNPRTAKPVGYAFVDVSTPTEAQRALSELNGKNILDRKVSVQLARKPDEPASAAAIAKGTEGEGQAQGQDQGHAQGQGRRRSTGRGRGRGRGRGGRGGRAGRANGTEGEAAATNGTAETNGTTASNGPTNVPGQVEPLTETTNEALSAPAGEPNTVSTKAPRQPRQPRQPREERQKGPPSDGVPSKTKVMVANLPYDITEEKLLEIFKEYAPTSAKIALRPIPRFMVRKLQARGEARKGRGFAFVTLANEELQQKAIKEVTGVPVGEREIVVKVAVDSPDKQDDETGAEKENGAPAASTAEGSANTEAAVAST